ncbi:MAG: glycosyltransferase family 2 protein, partial [Arenimonas sp.]
MSVYNGEGHLAETLDSVLMQEDGDFEFIVVNDGSTDSSVAILDRYASQNSRLKVIHQENTGLTRALIIGCSQARGEFIARQDAGDISLPGRLKKQSDFLLNHSDAVMCGCAVLFTGPLHEPLYETSKPMLQLDNGFRKLDIKHLSGPPHHGGTMFRREAYLKVGGYRPTFMVAQDIDLWLRMSELGLCLG